MELEVTKKRTLRVYWAFVWRSVIFSALAGFIAGAVGGAVLGVIYHNNPEIMRQYAPLVGAVAGYIASVIVGFFVMKLILKKKFKEFKIVLIANN